MRHAEFARHFLLGGVDVYADDLIGPHHARALDDVEANATQAEYRDIGTGPDLGRIDHRANAGGDPAADIANFVEGRVFAHFGQGNFRQHGEVRKGAAAHVMEYWLAGCGGFATEAAGAIGHDTLALRRADGGAKIAALTEAGFAGSAFGRVERDHMIAGLYAGDARADFAHNASAFMAQDGGEKPFRIQPIQRVGIRMANAGRHDFDQHFSSFGAI